jgi:hypothetical protein
MTLLYVQGFEGFSSTGDRTDLDVEFDFFNTQDDSEAGITTSGRVTGQAAFTKNGNVDASPMYLPVAGLSSEDDWIVGFAFKTTYNYYRPLTGNNNVPLIQFVDAANVAMATIVVTAGTLHARAGDVGGTVLGYANVSLTTYVWHYIECKINFHATTGSVALRVNDESVMTLTGQDTVGSSAFTSPAQIRMGNAGNDVRTEIDDIYICDDAGALHNDFLGDRGVRRLSPTGAGTTTDFSNVVGPANFEDVDDASPDGDATYVYSSTATNKDTYAFGNLASTPAAIEGVSVKSYVKKSDAGSRNFVHVVRQNAVELDSSVLYPSAGTYRYMQTIYPQNPDGPVTWTEATLNAAEFGFKVNA